ncbi:MAG: hypothetical protein IJE48_05290 [Clostridia bacterium]|nr:hypothetical protein [Clostridia bacterium]
MEQFRLKSIDELDLEFVTKIKGQAPAASKPVNSAPQQQNNDINSFSGSANSQQNYFSKPAQNLNAEPTYSPKPEAKKPRPLVPIGQNNAGYSPVGAPVQKSEQPFIPNINYGEPQVEEAPKKKSKGALAGKIVAIILLAVTVVVFVLGCFVSVFLDNGGSNLGGICFNTMSGDLNVNGVSPVSQGDLIISKKIEPTAYVVGDMIAVPSASTNGCDIHIINAINNAGPENAELITSDITTSAQLPATIMAADCYGVVNFYIPAVGGLLSFAIVNAILVCILFVLLAAFWCLLLVLLEKSGSSAPKEQKEPKAPKAKKEKNK